MPGKGFRRIPKQLVLSGNKRAAATLTGLADSELAKLEEFLRFRNLPQGSRIIHPFPGVIIKCWTCFTMCGVNIYVHPAGGPGEEPETVRECWCSCMYSTGIVVGFTDEEHQFGDEDVRYDVEICHLGKEYILFQNCVPTDFARYRLPADNLAGELVVVFLADLPFADCCNGLAATEEPFACEAEPAEGSTPVFWIVPYYVEDLKKWKRREV